MKRRTSKYANTILMVTAVMSTVPVHAGQLSPPTGSIAPTNRVQLDAQFISLPYTITQSGSYVLTSNLTGVSGQPGIQVSADNVTIDLNGFTLQGVSGSGAGIVSSTSPQHNVAILNGMIVNWAGHGIDLTNSSQSRIERVTVKGNGGHGILGGGQNGIIRGCIARGNVDRGIVVPNVSGNGSVGLVEGCVAAANGNGGILVWAGAVVSNCSALDNTGIGIIANNPGATIVNCTATNNTLIGISANGSSIRGCTSAYNGIHQIEVNSRAFVIENTCVASGPGTSTGAGIYVAGHRNRIEANDVVDNLRGIDVTGMNNLIIRNSASNNGMNYTIGPQNSAAQLLAPGSGFVSTDPWANFSY